MLQGATEPCLWTPLFIFFIFYFFFLQGTGYAGSAGQNSPFVSSDLELVLRDIYLDVRVCATVLGISVMGRTDLSWEEDWSLGAEVFAVGSMGDFGRWDMETERR